MAIPGECTACDYEREHGIKIDTTKGPSGWEKETGVSRFSVTRHLAHPPVSHDIEQLPVIARWEVGNEDFEGSSPASEIPLTESDVDKFIRGKGLNPTDWECQWRFSEWEAQKKGGLVVTLHAFKVSGKRKTGSKDGPAWPVIQPANPVTIAPSPATIRRIEVGGDYKVGLKCADPQIGFRLLPDGSFDPFHDVDAMSLFVETCREYQPDKITILGDFLDLPSQGRFDQEAAFANTTQMAINAGHIFLAQLREAAPNSEIILIEGNHDLRMKRFIESNALAAFGIKRAEMPDSWPVMSLPFLLRLDELKVKYIDAYPAATDWDNDLTRNIHGTKANSKGSTMAQYVHELPHVSTWAGHTHRCEIVYRTVLGARGEPIESYAANPGVLCRVDGAVPSVHGATGASGIPERIVEDWQQGFGILYFNETESWPQVVRIRNGAAVIEGRLVRAA